MIKNMKSVLVAAGVALSAFIINEDACGSVTKPPITDNEGASSSSQKESELVTLENLDDFWRWQQQFMGRVCLPEELATELTGRWMEGLNKPGCPNTPTIMNDVTVAIFPNIADCEALDELCHIKLKKEDFDTTLYEITNTETEQDEDASENNCGHELNRTYMVVLRNGEVRIAPQPLAFWLEENFPTHTLTVCNLEGKNKNSEPFTPVRGRKINDLRTTFRKIMTCAVEENVEKIEDFKTLAAKLEEKRTDWETEEIDRTDYMSNTGSKTYELVKDLKLTADDSKIIGQKMNQLSAVQQLATIYHYHVWQAQLGTWMPNFLK